jgi:hypothetical protein
MSSYALDPDPNPDPQFRKNYLRIWNIDINDWLFCKSADLNENIFPDREKTED